MIPTEPTPAISTVSAKRPSYLRAASRVLARGIAAWWRKNGEGVAIFSVLSLGLGLPFLFGMFEAGIEDHHTVVHPFGSRCAHVWSYDGVLYNVCAYYWRAVAGLWVAGSIGGVAYYAVVDVTAKARALKAAIVAEAERRR